MDEIKARCFPPERLNRKIPGTKPPVRADVKISFIAPKVKRKATAEEWAEIIARYLHEREGAVSGPQLRNALGVPQLVLPRAAEVGREKGWFVSKMGAGYFAGPVAPPAEHQAA